MKFYLPTDNPITQGYSSTHKGYDFSGLNRPDEVRCGANGEIIERIDLYDTNWTTTDTLTTKDYGNYIKVKHDDGTYALFAHLKKGSSLNKGTKVSVEQIIARIGNTGNSTGKHLHCEYRNSSNVNEPVEFYTNIEVPQITPTFTDQTKIPCGEYGNIELQALIGKLGDLKRLEVDVKSLQENIRLVMLTNETLTKQLREVLEKNEFLQKENADLSKKLFDSQQSPSVPQISVDSLSIGELLTILLKKIFKR